MLPGRAGRAGQLRALIPPRPANRGAAGRPWPIAPAVVGLIRLIWAAAFGAVREFVWADLRAGLLDLRGLSRATHGLVVLGFGLLFLTVGALLFNDLWRASFPLTPLTVGTPGRGSLVPLALLPSSMFLLMVAWTFALTGALHSHWAIRLGVLLFYLVAATSWNAVDLVRDPDRPSLLVGVAALLAVPVLFAARWRARPRPAVEFGLLLVCVGTTLALSQLRWVASWRASGDPVGPATLNANLVSMASLITPLLLLIGVNIADFTRRVAGWAAEIVEARLPSRLVYAVLAALVVSRLRDVASVLTLRLGASSPSAELLGYAGALAIPLGVWGVWWVVAGQRRGLAEPLTAEEVGTAGDRHAPKLILAYLGVSIATVLLFKVLLAVLSAVGASRVPFAVPPVIQAISQVSSQSATWQTALECLALLAVVPLARRGRHAPALFLGAFGVQGVCLALTAPGRPLSALAWTGPEPVTTWWILTFVAFGAFWLVRRELTTERAGRLIFLLLITYLLRQTDFISNPFSPFFSFAGIGFVAFGIVWDTVTIGSWANRETRGLPRVSRIFLYLGYVLLSVTLINWVLTSHNLAELEGLTGATALQGLSTFGKPLLYAIYVATLMLPTGIERHRTGTQA